MGNSCLLGLRYYKYLIVNLMFPLRFLGIFSDYAFSLSLPTCIFLLWRASSVLSIYKIHLHANKCDFSKALNIRIFSLSLDAMTERKINIEAVLNITIIFGIKQKQNNNSYINDNPI